MQVAACLLTVAVKYPASQLPVGELSEITLRGDFSSLSWDAGVRMNYVAKDTWSSTLSLNTTECSGAVLSAKPLISDKVWSVGSNFQVSIPGGVDFEKSNGVTLVPWFGNQRGRFEYIYDVFSPQLNNTR